MLARPHQSRLWSVQRSIVRVARRDAAPMTQVLVQTCGVQMACWLLVA
jgi:hypothetical protein